MSFDDVVFGFEWIEILAAEVSGYLRLRGTRKPKRGVKPLSDAKNNSTK